MNNALYFPYISIPKTPWLIQALLYWDEIASIVPKEFEREPKKLQSHMRQLIDDKMITLIRPDDYIWRIPDFSEKFFQILDSKPDYFWHSPCPLPSALKKNFRLIPRRELGIHIDDKFYSSIHIDKVTMGIIDELMCRGLAYKGDGKWYYVKKNVANYFMTYLAVGISGLANFRPVSDRYSGLSAFAGNTFFGMPPLRSRLRARVLEEILPVPALVDDFREIYRFKERYGEQLKGFKRRIERFLISIDRLPYNEAIEQVEDFIQEIREEKEELAIRMEEGHLSKIKFNTICAVCGSGAGLLGGLAYDNPYAIGAGTLGLAAQLWSAFNCTNIDHKNAPMAYAVYVQKKFR